MEVSESQISALEKLNNYSFFNLNLPQNESMNSKNNNSQNISDPFFAKNSYEKSQSDDFYGSQLEDIVKDLDNKIEKTEKNKNEMSKDNFELLEKIIDKESDTEPIKLVNFYSNPNDHFFCKKCFTVPIIKFISTNEIIYTCSCSKNCREKLVYFVQNTIIRINKKKEEEIYGLNVFFCKKHKGQKYFYYCDYCSQHLCRKCVRESNEHIDHCIEIFDELMYEADNNIKYINEKFNLNSSFFENDSDDFLNEEDKIIKTSTLIELISIIFNDYNSYTNKSHFKIISNFRQFIDDNNNKSKDLKELELKKQITVLNRRDLQKNLNNPEFVVEINIIENNYYNITQLCEADLVNLKALNLKGNNISCIEPLLNAKFKSIINLNLSVNKIGDNNIDYFCQLDFDQLSYINLYSNCLTDFNFFRITNNKKLPSLHKLYVGLNKFINSEINIKFDSSKIAELGLTKGIFNDESIHIIHNFSFDNLEILFLHSNNISSLSFIEDLELPKIIEFWINSNCIKEYYPLVKYKTLEKIIIRNNNINNIDNLVSFVNSFKNLKELDIKGNNIDLNEGKNEDIILKVKKIVKEFIYF